MHGHINKSARNVTELQASVGCSIGRRRNIYLERVGLCDGKSNHATEHTTTRPKFLDLLAVVAVISV